MIINGYQVLVGCISEDDGENIIKNASQRKAVHVLESQYFLKIAKCRSDYCCTPSGYNFRNKGAMNWVK